LGPGGGEGGFNFGKKLIENSERNSKILEKPLETTTIFLKIKNKIPG
jgi:hypothetical protein